MSSLPDARPDRTENHTLTRRAFTAAGALAGVGAFVAGSPAFAAVRRGTADALVPAFPGALGCGMYTTGGRGGDVYEVTNLNDSGPGSLREGVKGSNRTVVFRVSGTIYLSSRLDISGSNLTVAGQTAPGDGICIAGYPTRIAGQNVVVRYLRCRMGDIAGITEDAMWFRRTADVVLDHCSLTWSTDEALSPYENTRVSVQWCIVGESLTMSVNPEGRHGYGGIWGGENVSFHHNLIIHNSSRNPRFAPVNATGPDYALTVDHQNNVIYNWGFNSAYGGEDSAGINLIGNYYRPGPDTLAEVRDRIVEPTVSTLGGPGTWYVADNHMDGSPEVTADNTLGIDGDVPITLRTTPVPFPQPLPAEAATVAFDRVLNEAGAILPRRDSVDARLVEDVRRRTGRLINSQTEVGGWPSLASVPAPADSDHDGIPDAWETANGLNPNDPADRNTVGADGYTNLERYLNSIGGPASSNPSVTLLQPGTNALVAAARTTGRVVLNATATGHGAAIDRVEFYAGDELIGTATSAPYRVEWTGVADGSYFVTARAVDTDGNATSTTSTPVHVNRITRTAPWVGADVGSVPVRGATSVSGDAVTVKGSGAIGGTADSFRFAFQRRDGDCEIVARIDAISKVYPEVAAAVMVRADLAPSAPFAMMELTYLGSGKVSRFSVRSAHGAEAVVTQYPAVPEEVPIDTPYWVRLTRRGATVTGAVSPDGVTWHEVGAADVALPPSAFLGLAVDGHQENTANARYTTATFGAVTVR